MKGLIYMAMVVMYVVAFLSMLCIVHGNLMAILPFGISVALIIVFGRRYERGNRK